MSIIQQPTLFDLEILEQLDIEQEYFELFSPLDFSPLLGFFQKENLLALQSQSIMKPRFAHWLFPILKRFLM